MTFHCGSCQFDLSLGTHAQNCKYASHLVKLFMDDNTACGLTNQMRGGNMTVTKRIEDSSCIECRRSQENANG